MQPELKEQLEASAQQAGRSLNAEIVARLEGSFSTPESAILLSAFERLNTVLAQVELEKVSEKARTVLFAVNLREVCEKLLELSPDPKTRAELNSFIKDASAVIHGADGIQSEFTSRLEKLGATLVKRTRAF